jgi:phosphate transport system protein
MRPIDISIERIRTKLKEMSSLVENLVNEMSKGVYKIEDVSDIVTKIRLLRTEIHSLVIETIARFQPVASDLRYLIASLEISYGLFRFSRYALDMAYMFKNLLGEEEKECDFEITRKMLPHVVKMMRESIESFMYKDPTIANEVVKYDSNVDVMLAQAIERARKEINKCTYLDLIMAIYLERIADHSVYIASDTLFLI